MNLSTTRLAQRLLGTPLIRNSIRGELVEEMVAVALEPQWTLCGGDWGSCDLSQVAGPLRIQVKQSAARQSWHAVMSPTPRPCFSIAAKTGRWEGPTWIAEPSRNAEIFIFAWHPVADATADHRDPAQWLFHVVPETALPPQKSISLAVLQRLVAPVSFGELRGAVGRGGRSLGEARRTSRLAQPPSRHALRAFTPSNEIHGSHPPLARSLPEGEAA